jgi:SAM-dependent methyltransferase
MEDQSKVLLDPAVDQYRQVRLAHWEGVAARMDTAKSLGGYYHRRLSQIYQRLIPPGYRVIEFGGGQGNLLASLKPSYGVAVDFSPEMIQRGRMNHPELDFLLEDVHSISLKESFDYIIMSDILNDVWDVQKVFEQAQRLSGPKTRLIINTYSRLWEVPLGLARKLGLAGSVLQQNWLTVEDIINLGHLADFEPINHWQEFLWPFGTPIISSICNRYLVKLWPINQLGLANFIVLRPKPNPAFLPPNPSVSVIVPARNEEGNIEEIFTRTPEMGNITELIFVEGHSTDHTYQEVEKWIAQSPQRPCKLLKQTGVGKGDAIRFGLSQASGDVVMILDADLTVPPEDLSRFYKALSIGKGDFVNGVRLIYPMEKQAMRPFNFLGNKFFSLAFSWILGQPIKDTLCGTKALWKDDYERIAENRSYFGDFDPFGDFDLIFGAARLSLKIVDLPIRYRERKYGTTNIQRWKHGGLLLRMLIFAIRRLKFT